MVLYLRKERREMKFIVENWFVVCVLLVVSSLCISHIISSFRDS
jgi:hypothetical protein